MSQTVDTVEAAIQVAEEYAQEECVGQLGEVREARQEGDAWIVEFRTHTFSDVYRHRVRINRVGHVFAHERTDDPE